VRIFGVDPGSAHTGYGCIDASGDRHRVLAYGALSPPARDAFPDKLRAIHDGLIAQLDLHRPEVVAIEDLFYARNARSALKLGHVRGVVMLAAVEAGLPVVEYSPAEVKQAVVGYGRAEKRQVQQMVSLLLGLDPPPSRLDVTDALAVAVCHAHSMRPGSGDDPAVAPRGKPRSWRQYRPADGMGRRSGP
jgi:crossover junction endodeoxyribonuclease RuvC